MHNKQHTYSLIIFNHLHTQVYLNRNQKGYHIPSFEAEPIHRADAQAINELAYSYTKLDTQVCYCLNYQRTTTQQPGQSTYVLQCIDEQCKATAPLNWVAISSLSQQEFTDFAQYNLLQTVISNEEKFTTRPAWTHRNWLQNTLPWIDEQLKQHQLIRKGPLKQIKNWSTAAIWMIPTDAGLYYYKILPLLFSHEARLINYLKQRYNSIVPEVLAINEQNHSFIMHDFQLPLLWEMQDPLRYKQIFMAYAHMQINESNHLDDLLCLHCPDRRISNLWQQLNEITQAMATLAIDKPFSLSDDEIALWHALLPVFQQACQKLLTYHIPHTLEHGDFYAGNIAADHTHFVIFDWTDGCIAHPFFSMIPFFAEGDYDATLKNELIEAYLQPFEVFEPLSRLHEAFQIAMKVGELHYIYTYYRIIKSMDPLSRWQMEANFPSAVRRAIRVFQKDL